MEGKGEILAPLGPPQDYPFELPTRSFVQLGAGTAELPDDGPDLNGRTPLLAYGANSAPAVLAVKLAALPPQPLPVIRAKLADHDVVYSAHVSPYGAVPATLLASAGTTVTVYVAYPTPAQLAALTGTEPNYELQRLHGLALELETGAKLDAVDAYLSRHGHLLLDGGPVGLAAVPARGRSAPALSESQLLDRARTALGHELTPGPLGPPLRAG